LFAERAGSYLMVKDGIFESAQFRLWIRSLMGLVYLNKARLKYTFENIGANEN
jgi:hypothetical protein